jgi:hypothetical protein
MVSEADDSVLDTLHLMLTTPNPKHSASTRELNELGSRVVTNIIEARRSAPICGM